MGKKFDNFSEDNIQITAFCSQTYQEKRKVKSTKSEMKKEELQPIPQKYKES